MAINKLHIPILKFYKEHIETMDLANFFFIFSQICNAYISGTKPFIKNPNDKFCGIKSVGGGGGHINPQIIFA